MAHTQVKFVLGQPSLREGRRKRGDHLFTVGVGRPEITAAHGCWHLVWQLRHYMLP
jgi:hypothetical protein